MNNILSDWQESFLQNLSGATSEAEFTLALSCAALSLGFEYAAFGMRSPLPLSKPKLYMVNTYPAEWQARYAEQNYVAIDPTVAHGIKSLRPIMWDDQLFENAQTFWADARDHGLRHGWAQSTVDANGAVGMLTLARSDTALSVTELRENALRMSWLVQMAQAGMARVFAAKRPQDMPAKLTAREIDVLRWTADGKTAGEIGMIMSISERTVNFHVANSLEKLGTNNKTAGVIKAVLLRLL